MKKIEKKMIAAICCAGVLAAGAVGTAMAQSPVILAGSGQTGAVSETQQEETAGADEASQNTIMIWGTVLGVEDGSILIDNQSGVSSQGEMILNIDEEHSRVLDAVDGFPVGLDDLQKGEVIYAYIGPAMTMSLPPMTTAEMVICKVPADFRAPEYVKVKEMQEQQDGSWVLTSVSGTDYKVPADCNILPYLTRNIVRLDDVNSGSECLIWSDENGNCQKIVLFAD